MVTLPFLSLFYAILNQWGTYCLINLSLSLLLLMILTDWIMFLIITILGLILALIWCMFLFDGSIFPKDIWNWGLIFYSIGFSTFGFLFSRRKEEAFAKIGMARMCGEVVAHEMRTFLLSMKNYVLGSKKYFGTL